MRFGSEDISLKLYNTETKKKEEISPIDGKTVRMYACGPTVYDYAHIGNFRTYIFEDLLRRTIEFFGMQIKLVMNITDIDDKTIKGAIKEGVSLDKYTEKYKNSFFEDLKTLNILPADNYPEATAYVEKMIEMIQVLIDKGFAYKGGDGSVYYAIDKFEKYGRLSHLNLEDLQAGASQRVISDEYEKDNVADFVLWKGYDKERDGDFFWESPFGKGRPGWHLECSTMAIQLFGDTIDIHAGGVDNIFPHHENEIAQSEAFSGKTFVKHWVHSEHLIVDNKKMSKSLGNFYTLRDLKKYSGREIRYILLHTHYRSQLNFTLEGLDGAKSALQRIDDFILRMQEWQNDSSEININELLEDFSGKFGKDLADDLNISAALSVLFDMIRNINHLCDKKKLSSSDAKEVLSLLQKFDSVLAVLFHKEKEEKIPKEVQEALEKREQARKDKDWPEADRCRNLIQSQGYRIEDSPQGPRLRIRK